MIQFCLATGNQGKAREIERLLGGGITLALPPAGFTMPDETGSTYADNALIKARALCQRTDSPSLGDDSGIEVEALAGRPGIGSARYAPNDSERVTRLLTELLSAADDSRSATFRCILALVLPDGREYTADGSCRGSIALEPRGIGGFGYDPVFVPLNEQRTFAEMPAAEKDAISHRGRAARAFAALASGLACALPAI